MAQTKKKTAAQILGLQFPKNPSARGTPIELPHPKIVNFIKF